MRIDTDSPTRWPPRGAWSVFTTLAVAAGALLGAPVQGQSRVVSGPPEVLSALHGSWEGSGVLLGRPGAFRMVWETREGPFLRLPPE